jgi:hypothetical protein
MRPVATAIAIALMTATCHADPLAAKVVAVFKETCTEATTPEALIAAGEKSAAVGKWKLIASGPAPLPMLHMDRGPKISYATQWDLNLPEMPGSKLSMSIVRPPLEDINKYSVCLVQPTIELGANELAQQIDEQFGSNVTKDVSGKYRDETRWFFTSEKAAGNCGRTIVALSHLMASRGTPTTLLFLDVEFGKKWPASEMAKCPT